MVAFCLCTAAPAIGQLKTLETERVRLIYFDPTLAYLAPYAARCVETALDFQAGIYGFESPEKLTALLKDFSDRGNAAAGPVPRNQLLFDVAPTDFSFETFVAPERLYMITNHELTHVTTMDQASSGDRFFRRLFQGKVVPIAEHPETVLYLYLTNPRLASPSWFKEGIAVFNETWMAGGIGRAQGSYDEMVFRSMVRDGSHFYDPLGLVSEGVKVDFQVGVNSYLYGTRFMSYLAHEYSPDHLVRWISRGDGTRRYFLSEFREVFGAPLPEIWNEWIEFEREFQSANLERIREYPVTPHEDLAQRALGSVSRAYFDAGTNTLFAGLRYPGVVAHLAAISLDDGSIDKLIDIKKPALYRVTSLAFDPDGRRLFYTTDHSSFRDLRVYELDSGKGRVLVKDARVGDLVFDRSDGAIWGVRHRNGIASLVRIEPPYDSWSQVRSWPYGEVLYDPDVSPDGERLSIVVGEIDGRHLLRVFRVADLVNGDLAQERLRPIAQTDFGTTLPMNFVFSSDGEHLWGSSYLTGAANLFRVDSATGEWEAMTNVETGFFRPIPLDDGSVIAFRYTGEGFLPARLEVEPLDDINAITFLGQEVIRKHPQLDEWQVTSPAEVDLDAVTVAEEEYGGFRSIHLESLYPVLEGYKDSAAFGLRANFSDYLSINRASVVATYSPDDELRSNEQLHLELGFERYNFRARATLNDADFYDLFGPTKKSRRGYSVGAGWTKLLVWDEPRRMELSIDGTFYGDLETLPQFQNVVAPFKELVAAEARLHYENLRGSLGRVDDEKGLAWEIVAAGSHVNSETIPSLRAGFDVGVALPIENSSLWLRTDAGGADGRLDDPFANFFFGGFGNNYVDRGAVKRYREHYAFPGLRLNEAGGRTFARSLLEWNLPPIRFRRVGTQSLYLTWARPALFVGGLVTNPDVDREQRELGNAGVQIDFRFTLISNLDLTLSVGYASAFERHRPSSDEFMISLKVL